MPGLSLEDHINHSIEERLVELRHHLHQFPELSGQERATSDRLFHELSEVGTLSVTRIAKTGILARIPGTDPDAPIVAIRGDIDALPISEETDASFASTLTGVMHACGHDIHASWTVGAALLLKQTPAIGDVVVLLQPAEETAMGAPAMISEGALDGVAAVLGAHVDMHYEVGQVVAESGSMAASADEFEILLNGAGCHAARPHEGNNPIPGAAALALSLSSIVKRLVDPDIPAALSVATIQGGLASNVIPESVRLSGTARATDANTRALLLHQIDTAAEAIAVEHDLEVDVSITEGTPPLVNTPQTIRWVREAVETILGEKALVPLKETNLGGEDFACYLERIPGCFFRVGGRGRNQESIPAHTSRYLPDDQAISVGSVILAQAARNASRELASAR